MYALDEPGLSEMLFSWLDKKIYTQEIVFGARMYLESNYVFSIVRV